MIRSGARKVLPGGLLIAFATSAAILVDLPSRYLAGSDDATSIRDQPLDGRVTDEGGRALPGALVTARSGPVATSVFTDHDGRFRLPAGTGGELRIRASGFRPRILTGAQPAAIALEPDDEPWRRISSADLLGLLPPGDVKRRFVLDRTGCHQFDHMTLGAVGDAVRDDASWHRLSNDMIRLFGHESGFPIMAPGRDAAATATWFAAYLTRERLHALRSLRPTQAPVPAVNLTEYDFPTPQDLPHDLIVAPDGRVVVTGMFTHRMEAVSQAPAPEGNTTSGASPAAPAAATMAQERPDWVTADDGVTLHLRIVGSGDPVVVVPLSAYVGSTLDGLAQGRRLVLYDPRGRGRSGAPEPEGMSLDRQVSDLKAVRRHLGVERISVIGWSGLGLEAFVWAMRHPDRVERIVQLAPVPPRQSPWMAALGENRRARRDEAALAELIRRRDEDQEFRDDPAAYCREVNALTYPADFADPANVARVSDVCEHPNEWPVNLGPRLGALLQSFGTFDWRDSLSLVAAPRLVIHGAEDPIPLEGNLEWVRGRPESRILILEGAGHWPLYEREEAVVEAIDQFLRGEWPAGARAHGPES